MKIDEAIVILNLIVHTPPSGASQDLIDANKLGIEALKFIAFWNEKQLPQQQIHLPGETE